MTWCSFQNMHLSFVAVRLPGCGRAATVVTAGAGSGRSPSAMPTAREAAASSSPARKRSVPPSSQAKTTRPPIAPMSVKVVLTVRHCPS